MYMKEEDEMSDAEYSLHQGRNYASLTRTRRPARPPTSLALDDNFDTATTEVPTEWKARNNLNHGLEYEESISGYQNYVHEIERKMGNEDELHRQEILERKPQSQPPPLAGARANGYHVYRGADESEVGEPRTGDLRRGTGAGGAELPLNARRVSGRRGKIEVFEEKVTHDGPERTISLWRERVAESSRAGSQMGDEGRSVANSHAHRRIPSNPALRRVVSDCPAGNGVHSAPVSKNVHGGGAQKSSKATYERSEYMVAYRPSPKGGLPVPLYQRSESVTTMPLPPLNVESRPLSSETQSKSPTSPTRRRGHGRSAMDRREFVMTYPQTPPHTGSSASSPNLHLGDPAIQRQPSSLSRKMSGTFNGAGSPEDGAQAAFMSPVELILASCEPSLLHIAPILFDLGMQRMEHLCAIARLSEETRNREVKDHALKRGVTVIEWAILLDKLQTL